ncbi:MAG: hypothetical protein Q8R00_00040 [Candidatus Nanoarchaeia archaeon]|nr:hypothetical protein [Candidatus Nanoarchaeia archaeon]
MQENNPVPTRVMPTVDSPQTTVVQAVDQKPSTNSFLIILLSSLLFISVIIAGFFAYQTQKLVKELTVLKTESIPTPEAMTEPTTEPVATASPSPEPSLTPIASSSATPVSTTSPQP